MWAFGWNLENPMTAFLIAAMALSAQIPPEPSLPEEAQAVVKQLGDPDPKVRNDAATKLRLLARRVDRSGGQRIQRGDEFEPKVKGLVPYLIRASADEDESNRSTALYALADTLDPTAVAAIRVRLKDKSQQVRFTAACLLTEFKDASGLDELKKALGGVRARQIEGTFVTEMLLASFERITGKSFGAIPPNPFISSDTRVIAASEKRYAELLDAWAAWWDWTPGK
jgi:HEAT repeat protein